MSRKLSQLLLASLIAFVPLAANAADKVPGRSATAKEAKALRKVMLNQITTECYLLDAPEITSVFKSKLYFIETGVKFPSGASQTLSKHVVAAVNRQPVFLDDTTTTQPCPTLTTVLKDYTLKSEDDAKKLEAALNKIYDLGKYITDDDLGKREVLHEGNTWTFVRGKFFDDGKGFIVKTDNDGKINKVTHSLDIKMAKK